MFFILLPQSTADAVAALEPHLYTTYDKQALSFVSYLSKIFLWLSTACLRSNGGSNTTHTKNNIGPALIRRGRLRSCFIVGCEAA